jgi:capsular polysaccharide transport system permease protein
MSNAARPTSQDLELWRGLDIQLNVIGALILRELHTRYGRENIGYLWMLLEPGLLATSVAAIHFGQKPHDMTIAPVGFAIGGYCTFIIFRSVVGRAETTLTGNQPLLFHRVVTIFDMLVSRAVLEVISTVATLIVLLAGACALNLAKLPARPLLFLEAIALISWFSFAVSMPICAATYVNKAVSKFVHPVMYAIMPISGSFFLLDWIPEPYRGYISWFPLVQIFELLHTGQFESVNSKYYSVIYIISWCMFITLLGLFSLRVVRRHIHLS